MSTMLATVSLSLSGNPVLVIFLLLILIALAILFYRYTLPPLPPRRRIMMSTLRALALVLLLLVLFEPILRFVRHDEQRPAIAMLIDNSQSVTIKDRMGDRQTAVKEFLRTERQAQFPSGSVVKYYTFSSKLQSANEQSVDSLTFHGEATYIAEALAELKEQLIKDNIQEAVLVSDGNYTTGKNPLYDAEGLGIPIYTVGVGDTLEQKDVLVGNVVTNTLAYAETKVPVDVTVRSSGYKGENVEVTISEGTTVLDRKTVTLQEGTREYPVRLFVEPKDEGMKKYTVSVSKLPGELTERNNTHSFFMKVLKSKLRILLLAGAPNPDVAVVRQALVEDEHLTVQSFVQKGAGEFYEGTLSRATLDSADCLVLIGYPSVASSAAMLQQVHDATEQKKLPVLFINSKTIDYGKLQLLESFLPFAWSGATTNEVLVDPSIVDKHKNDPIVVLDEHFTVDTWQKLPPIYKTQTTFRSKPEANTLAMVKLQNIVLPEPLILTRDVARQKTFAITGYGVWRWRLLTQGNDAIEKCLPLLLSNAVRWLTTKEEDKRVRVISEKEAFTTAEPVQFTGQVYDDQLRHVDNAELIVDVQRGRENIRVALNAIGNGRYEGSLDGLGEGDYTFTGKATADGTTFGEDKGRFSVGQVNAEFIETKMNKQLLEQIAFRTGGKYYDIGSAGTLAADIGSSAKLADKELVQSSEIELWNWQYLAAAIMILFGIEWFLRRRSGML
jgi:hypothetical protein